MRRGLITITELRETIDSIVQARDWQRITCTLQCNAQRVDTLRDVMKVWNLTRWQVTFVHLEEEDAAVYKQFLSKTIERREYR